MSEQCAKCEHDAHPGEKCPRVLRFGLYPHICQCVAPESEERANPKCLACGWEHNGPCPKQAAPAPVSEELDPNVIGSAAWRAAQLAHADLSGLTAPVSEEGRIYPCKSCGTLRTESEGGRIFTVCDACWNERPLWCPECANRVGERFAHFDHESNRFRCELIELKAEPLTEREIRRLHSIAQAFPMANCTTMTSGDVEPETLTVARAVATIAALGGHPKFSRTAPTSARGPAHEALDALIDAWAKNAKGAESVDFRDPVAERLVALDVELAAAIAAAQPRRRNG